ncbi:FAS1 domain-containing protein [Trichoderma citrinoviride]|uniref:FAS1 domain-containing protein n=1 Tax=Trichoderma citrinoviride TaxID=58853 RepID=A0A2T4B956_9HYPO|nr:FAS1 domain-containing protein [Trichoderma citrinoviride]PTB65855.1 FAS1 domain-containing protein [Trichoderma citrinoviride]
MGPHHLDDDIAAAESFFNAVSSIRGHIHDDFSQAVADLIGLGYSGDLGGTGSSADGGHHHHHGHKHGDESFTIYELIQKSKYTTKFAKILDEHPDVVDVLNSTKANHTLFVPVDSAFDEDHKKPDKEFVEKALLYHIALGEYPARRILHSYTLPTALDEELLGGEPQRLRASVGLGGVKLNFYSKVIAADIAAKNGIIHAVNHILVPPPYVGRIITLFPDRFSTLLLAYEKTEFVKFIHGVNLKGSTVFVPTNEAFHWLGPRANAFLFNTDRGREYLKAILKYNIAPNATLYTDAFYDETDSKQQKAPVHESKTEHYDLPTLLGDAHISVDIARIFGFASIKVNGFTRVVIPNGVAKNGVIQVVNRVPLPPHKGHGGHQSESDGGIEVEDLISRLEDWV